MPIKASDDLVVICRHPNGDILSYAITVPDTYPATIWPDHNMVVTAVHKERQENADLVAKDMDQYEYLTAPVQVLFAIAGEDVHVECDWRHKYANPE